MRNPFRREKALTASPETVESLRNRSANFTTRLGGTNQRVQAAYERAQSANFAWMYANSPAVRTVVDLIARNVAQLDLRLYEEVDEAERQARPDHPAALSLRYPNDAMSPDQFVFALVANFLVFDNAYATKHRSRPEDPIKFVVIPPQRVEVHGRGLAPEGYRVQNQDGTWFPVEGTIPPDGMFHWRGWNSADPRIGVSRLDTLRTVIAEEAAVQTALVELVKSGLAEPTWVSRPMEAPEWSGEARDRFEEDLANRLGKANTKPAVLEEGMELKGYGVSPRNAQMLEVRKYALQQVATLFGVPLGMVGLDSDVQAAQSEFYADTLPPICEALTRQLSIHVLQAEYDETELCFEFDLDEKLMGDERLKALTSAAGVPPLTRNEARAKLNLPPVEGGDEPITPANVALGGKPSVDVMPVQDPTKPEQDGSAREGDPYTASMNGNGKALPVAPTRREVAERRDEWAEDYQELLKRHFDRQKKTIKSAGGKGKAATDDRWNRELAKELNDLSRRHFKDEGKHAGFRLATTFDPSRGQNWLAAKSLAAAELINRTTQQQIEAEGADAAFSLAAEKRATDGGLGYATDIAAFAGKVAAEQAPGERMVTIDGGECPICAEFQGSWPANDVPGWPSYHPSCNCVAQPS